MKSDVAVVVSVIDSTRQPWRINEPRLIFEAIMAMDRATLMRALGMEPLRRDDDRKQTWWVEGGVSGREPCHMSRGGRK